MKVSQKFNTDGQDAASVAKELQEQTGTIKDAITEFLANRTSGNFSIVVGAVEAANVTRTSIRRTLQESNDCVEGAALSVSLEFETPADQLLIEALERAWPSLVSLRSSNSSGLSVCGQAEFDLGLPPPSPPPPSTNPAPPPASPPLASVDLGTAEGFALLTRSGITTTGETEVTALSLTLPLARAPTPNPSPYPLPPTPIPLPLYPYTPNPLPLPLTR